MDQPLRRISLLIREEQYERLNARGLNLSGLVRDLVDDYLSDDSITLAVTAETRALYDRIVSNAGSADVDVERYFRAALGDLLRAKIEEMRSLEREAFGEGHH